MYYDTHTTVFKNGSWMKASQAMSSDFSQTLHYGSGVFEGLRAYENVNGCNIFRAKDHFDRLINSCKKVHLTVPYSSEELVQIAYQLLDTNNMHNAYIRPLVFSGENMYLTPSSDVHLFMGAWKWGKYLGSRPLNVMVSSFQRPNPKSTIIDAKIVGHYTTSILATTEAKQLGYDEALLLDMNDHVAEGPGANFFFEKDNVLYTPPAGHIFPGITRQTIMSLARELGIPVVEKFFNVDEVYDADHAFFAGTAVEMAPVASINGEKLKGTWEESAGYNIYLMYRQKVQFNEYQGLTIV